MNEAIIYADGSSSPKNKDGGYAALVVPQNGAALLVKGSRKNTTNNAMEIMAVLQGLEVLPEGKYKIYIVSDSAYVINTIKNQWYKKWDLNTRKNGDLWKQLMVKMESHEIEAIHIMGHADDEYNNLMDSIAVDARINSLPDTIKEFT